MTPEERTFFAKIKQAAFANPFGRERQGVDLELTELSAETPNSEILAVLIARITDKIKDVLRKEPRGVSGLAGEDRLLVQYGILFALFHTYCTSYDRLIEEQIRSGAAPCRVAFAGEALQKFADFGFPRQEALHYFSLFFQMRRAFYFITGIAGRSMCIRDLRSSLWDNIFTRDVGLYNRYLWNRMEDFSTMLLGETGTGKGLAAAAIGRSGYIPFNDKLGTFSESFAQAFVSINLSEYQEQLIESELFGHKKGAFTGAIESHDGIFSRCSPCGAIFLDEIGDVAIPVQIKLLQVLQERFFTPVGSHKQERFQGRVIAATNRDIDLLRDRGTFRNDFYYRLCSDLIEVPPLRRRLAEDPGEIDEILGFIVNRILGQPSAEIVEKVKEVLRVSQPKDYAWPGNVRELEQCVRRILLKNSYEWHRQEAADNAAARLARGLDNGRMTAQEMLSDYCRILYDRLGTYEAVARTTRLDRRTVKKYIES
jgi:hypothetical protein